MRNRTSLLAVLLIIALITSAFAQDYYADVSINVDSEGLSTISGRTNHPTLEINSTDAWTSKSGSAWIFNLTLPQQDTFSDFIYSVNLPQGASVNDFNSTGTNRITTSGNRISIQGSGENTSFSVLIKYQFYGNTTSTIGTTQNYFGANIPLPGFLIYGLILFLIIIIAFLVYKREKKQLTLSKSQNEAMTESTSLENDEPEELKDFDALTERQRIILETIKTAKKPINQAVICEKLDLPKSSVSRNIDALERFGLITKTRTGMSTMISIKKD